MYSLEFPCETGCNRFTCGSIKHHKDCKNYPESQAELLDKLKEENKELKEQIKNQTSGFCDPYCFAGIKKDEEIKELKEENRKSEKQIKELKTANEKLNKENDYLVNYFY